MRRWLLALILLLALIAASAWWHIRAGMDTRSAPGSLETYVAQTVRAWSVPSKYKTLRNPASCTEEVLGETREHWADHCATCHANNGSGDTLLGRTMYPRPPDMRRPDTQNQSDGELYYVIKNGVRLTGMPAFGAPGDNDTSSWHLVCLIRHLPKMSAEEELEMRRMNPKTPADLEEERQEAEFLNGASTPTPEHHHHP
ncbi:MAG TPA: c-type cytochrome [Bryobacteraceae bacterium]|nr:c-type cytochrome [Bryobacteraceae bacterium]